MTYTPQELPAAGSTVLVGMSGGVDSTLTALLLKEKVLEYFKTRNPT